MERGRIDLSRLQMLILDEADRMLDMGFMPDIERINQALPKERQTLMFSATFEGEIARIAKNLLNNPKVIQIASQKEKHANIEQRLHFVDDMTHKNKLLEHLLIAPDVNQAIVFTSTKRHADLLAEDLYAAGHKTAALHGDMTQGARNRTLTKLRHGDVKVLVATDVAARGIDVHGITHVINYDLPKFAEDYVHRIGRTGRAGNTGIAVSFASHMDRHQIRKIEQFTGQRLEASVIEGFEPKRPAPRMDGPGNGRNDRGGRNNRSNGSRTGERSFGDRAAHGRADSRPQGDRPQRSGQNAGFKPRDAAPRMDGNSFARPERDGNRADGNRAPRDTKFGSPRGSRTEGNRDGNRGNGGARRPRDFA